MGTRFTFTSVMLEIGTLNESFLPSLVPITRYSRLLPTSLSWPQQLPNREAWTRGLVWSCITLKSCRACEFAGGRFRGGGFTGAAFWNWATDSARCDAGAATGALY